MEPQPSNENHFDNIYYSKRKSEPFDGFKWPWNEKKNLKSYERNITLMRAQTLSKNPIEPPQVLHDGDSFIFMRFHRHNVFRWIDFRCIAISNNEKTM